MMLRIQMMIAAVMKSLATMRMELRKIRRWMALIFQLLEILR